MTLDSELQKELLRIKDVPRKNLTGSEAKIYKSVYHAVTRKLPPTGCSQLCTTVYLLVRNVIKKIEAVTPTAPSGQKAKVEVKKVGATRITASELKAATVQQLKEIATDRDIPFAKNATKPTMIKLLTEEQG